jgi:hypothetical protein
MDEFQYAESRKKKLQVEAQGKLLKHKKIIRSNSGLHFMWISSETTGQK